MRRICTTLYLLLILAIATGFSQTKAEKEKIIQKTNVQTLELMAKDALQRSTANKEKALQMAKSKGWVIREDKDGKLRELIGVTPDGQPLYYTTFNVDASKSTRANTLNNGGSLGLNLEGQNMTAHVWDGGLARTTHQEYDGIGGNNRFSIGDGTTTLHYHSAHVTGTIMASGVDPNAKGMAPQAFAVGYEWTNDVAEATTAAANGMLLSNHSYGYGAEDLPDAMFGQYGYDAVDWDGLMYNAPYYLMCVAAGNDGDDNTSNGAPLGGNSLYDKLSGHATAKNNLVVANAEDAIIEGDELVSVVINSSSSEGPTDDYRIKPDITGNGTQLYSTYESADDAYNSITGTSMATPNVTGTLLLLQQYYNQLNGNFMKAATLKGLALHTADDAGATGPDAIFGWGLMNGKAAAQTIANEGLESIIDERTLANGGSYSISVVANGIDDLVASISWTDPAGTANSGTNSSTPALVNDLDIRVTKSATTYFPWKLTGITSNTEGDNTVDPYEKILIDNAACGDTYTITVTHKGTLSTAQNYSLIVTGIKEASTDAGITSVAPTVSSCEYSNNTPIEITVANMGGSTITNVDVEYEVRKADNTLVGNGTYTIASIAACNSNAHTVYADMSVNGETYNVTVSIALAGDENSANNTYMGSFMPMNVDLTVPGSEYSTSFEAGSLAEIGWSYEDVNGDGGQAVWYIYDDADFAHTGSGFAIQFADAGDAQSNDWMFSPCLYLKAGQTYQVSYFSREFQDRNENLSLFLGTAANSAAMTTTLETGYEPTTAWSQRTPASFTVPSDGTYYLGWRSYNMSASYAPAIDDVTITNTSAATLPQVTTSAITNIGATSADGGGNVTNGGSSAVTARGIVYNTSINPTLSDNVVAAGTGGTGTFSGLTMSSLTPGTIYYVRAYATNSSGTVYGTNESFTTLTSMNFVSSTTVQNNSNVVNQGVTDQDILEIQIEMDGALSPISATSFTLSTNGSTNAANDIAAAKLYYTGTSGTFATGTQFGSVVSNPDGSFTITGSQELVDGTNYFWLAYDISASAGDGNVVDAECSSITVGTARTPDVTAPAGGRLVFVDPCATPVSVFPFSNDFADNTLPTCWDNVDNQGNGQIWQFNNPGSRTFASTTSGNGFAILDSDNYSTGNSQNADLISPTLDFTNYTSISLSFEHYFKQYDASTATVSYSTDGGSNWTNIGSWTATDEGTGDSPAQFSQDLTAQLAGQSNVKFKWNYIGTWAYYWAIDDIEIDATPITPQYTVTFTVTDAGDSHPIDGASIAINSTTLITNASGVATIDLEDGSYPYTITKTGYDNATGTVVVSGGAVSEAVSMSITTYTLTFVVEDEAGQPVQSASISINSNTLTTDASGEATIELPNGTYGYTVSKAGYDNATSTVTIADANATETVTLNAPIVDYTVTFTVTDAGDSHPIDEASIAINSTTLTTNASGVATIDLENGSYPYTITKTGYDNATGTIAVSGGAVSKNVSMSITTYTLTFVVEDEANQPVQSASISINSNTLTTDVNGEATIELPNGTYGYTVSKAGYDNATASVTIADANATETVTLIVPVVDYTVTFTVTDAGDSHPIDGASIAINSTTLTTNASGVATIDLEDGSYPYTITKTGYDNATGTVFVSGGTVSEDVSMSITTYTLTFVVEDEASQPVQSASISINSNTLTTDASGEATIELANGTYGYTVSKAGYDNATSTVTIADAAATETVTLIVPVVDYTVTFTVTDAGDSHPIDGASIAINSTTLTTNASGVATIDLENGSYNYIVTKNGFDEFNGSVTVSDAAENVSVTLIESAAPQYTVTFNVTDGATAIDGASVVINGETLTTNASGAATIDLENGSYNYTVTKNGFEEFNGSVTVNDAAENVSVTLIESAAPQYTVTFNVTDGATAIDGASVAINGETLTTNASGAATIDLENGSYNYTVNKNGFEEFNGSVTVNDAAENVSVTLIESAAPQYTVTFNVTDGATAIDGASVAINGETLTTNASGAATIDLENGSYNYIVTKNGFDEFNGSVTVSDAAENVSVTLIESAAPQYTVTFNVTDGATAIDGASVAINGETLTTNASGAATIDLENGSYNYTVTKNGFEEFNGSVTVNDAVENVSVTLIESAAPQYTVTFNVTDGATAIDGASVVINGETLTTNASGAATIDLENGSYNYTVNKNGFDEVNGSVTVNDAAENVSVTLIESAASQYTVTFTVTDAGDSHPIDGASIAINSTTLTTNASGVATIDLEDGSYPYTITKTGYDNATGTVLVSGGAVSEAVSMSVLAYTVTFVVTFDAAPIEGAAITINNETIYTDVLGVATIGLLPGTYDFTMVADGYETYTDQVTIVDEDVTVIISGGSPMYTVTFEVLENNHPIEGAIIQINGSQLETDSDGLAQIELDNGQYSFACTLDGYEMEEGTITVSGDDVYQVVNFTGIDESAKIDFVMYPNPSNGSFKIDFPGTFEVVVINQIGKQVYQTQSTDGEFISIPNVADGMYLIQVRTKDQTFTKQMIIRKQ